MPPRTRAEMVEETRAKLLTTARAAFAKYGYAAASMDEMTADAGLTRGALYHNFGDKRGLFAAVVDEIDSAMAVSAQNAGNAAGGGWAGLVAEGAAYIKMALEPDVQRIVLLDGPSVLGDPSQWPSQGRCLHATISTLRELEHDGQVKAVDIEALARLLHGAALTAAMWVAVSPDAHVTLPKAVAAFECLVSGCVAHR